MKAFKSVIGIFVVILWSSAFAGCSAAPAPTQKVTGGHDGGGADLWVSRPEQVRAAIHWALEDLRRGSELSWLRMASPYGPRVKNPGKKGEQVSLMQCLGAPFSCQDFEKVASGEVKPIGDGWDLLSQSKLEIKEDGPCSTAENPHAAASVSKFEIGADICLSVPELSRTVPEGLRAQVASVLAHEMAHLLGYDEELAEQVQKGIVENFSSIVREDGEFLAYRLVTSMMKADSALRNAASLSTDENPIVGYELIAQAGGIVSTVLDMLPDGVNDNSIPVAKPEMYDEVSREMMILSNALSGYNSRPLPDSEFDREVAELRLRHVRVGKLLEAFLGQQVQRFDEQ